jgi:hypothetical protein
MAQERASEERATYRRRVRLWEVRSWCHLFLKIGDIEMPFIEFIGMQLSVLFNLPSTRLTWRPFGTENILNFLFLAHLPTNHCPTCEPRQGCIAPSGGKAEGENYPAEQNRPRQERIHTRNVERQSLAHGSFTFSVWISFCRLWTLYDRLNDNFLRFLSSNIIRTFQSTSPLQSYP